MDAMFSMGGPIDIDIIDRPGEGDHGDTSSCRIDRTDYDEKVRSLTTRIQMLSVPGTLCFLDWVTHFIGDETEDFIQKKRRKEAWKTSFLGCGAVVMDVRKIFRDIHRVRLAESFLDILNHVGWRKIHAPVNVTWWYRDAMALLPFESHEYPAPPSVPSPPPVPAPAVMRPGADNIVSHQAVTVTVNDAAEFRDKEVSDLKHAIDLNRSNSGLSVVNNDSMSVFVALHERGSIDMYGTNIVEKSHDDFFDEG